MKETARHSKLELGMQHELLLNVIDSLPDLVCVKDEAGRFVFCNRAHRQFLGLSRLSDVVGRKMSDFFPAELAAELEADDHAVLKGEPEVLQRELRLRDAQGVEHWVVATKQALRDPQGHIIGLVAVGRDVTAERQADEALARERDLLQALMDNIPDTIYFKDTASRFTRVNKAQAKVLGVAKPEDAIGKTDADFFTPEHARAALEDEQKIIQSKLPITDKAEWIRRGDGQFRWVSTTKTPILDRSGQVVGLVGISRDITARKLAEEQVAQYSEVLREKNAQFEADLMMAREIQQALLPQQYPSFPRGAAGADNALQFCHRYLSSEAVGGDFFDVNALSDTVAGVFICDVMGKGARAALVTAMIRTLVEDLALLGDEPGEFLAGINRGLVSMLQQTQMPLFASAFYLVVDSQTGRVRYANAGHPSPFLLRPSDGTVTPLSFAEGRRPGAVLGPGDRLVLFTDGLFEVEGAGGEDYGLPRLQDAVRRRVGMPAAQLFDELLREVREFSATGQFSDDVCLLAMDVTRLSGAPS
jgi:sigma-B regulation protein RsbU (phosphoserine phosphatase)